MGLLKSMNLLVDFAASFKREYVADNNTDILEADSGLHYLDERESKWGPITSSYSAIPLSDQSIFVLVFETLGAGVMGTMGWISTGGWKT